MCDLVELAVDAAVAVLGATVVALLLGAAHEVTGAVRDALVRAVAR